MFEYAKGLENGLYFQIKNGSDTVVTGKYLNGLKTDEWVYNKDGRHYKMLTYKDGLLDGRYEEYYDDERLKIRAYYSEDYFSGPYIKFYPNGNIEMEGQYILATNFGSSKCGEWKYYFPNKRIERYGNYNCKSVNFIDTFQRQRDSGFIETLIGNERFNVKTGVWHYFDMHGELLDIKYYNNGVRYERE